jgi:hypothetical protein
MYSVVGRKVLLYIHVQMFCITYCECYKWPEVLGNVMQIM